MTKEKIDFEKEWLLSKDYIAWAKSIAERVEEQTMKRCGRKSLMRLYSQQSETEK